MDKDEYASNNGDAINANKDKYPRVVLVLLMVLVVMVKVISRV